MPVRSVGLNDRDKAAYLRHRIRRDREQRRKLGDRKNERGSAQMKTQRHENIPQSCLLFVLPELS